MFKVIEQSLGGLIAAIMQSLGGLIAGIMHKVSAHVDDSPGGPHILIGMSTIKQFRVRANFSVGRYMETRWYVSHYMTGMRRQHYLTTYRIHMEGMEGENGRRMR